MLFLVAGPLYNQNQTHISTSYHIFVLEIKITFKLNIGIITYVCKVYKI